MEDQINRKCSLHADKYECPDSIIDYSEKFNEYGIIIHDGGTSKYGIQYCPWCGMKLPESKREEWFDELDKLGFDNPWEQEIPDKYKSDQWYRAQQGNVPGD